MHLLLSVLNCPAWASASLSRTHPHAPGKGAQPQSSFVSVKGVSCTKPQLLCGCQQPYCVDQFYITCSLLPPIAFSASLFSGLVSIHAYELDLIFFVQTGLTRVLSKWHLALISEDIFILLWVPLHFITVYLNTFWYLMQKHARKESVQKSSCALTHYCFLILLPRLDETYSPTAFISLTGTSNSFILSTIKLAHIYWNQKLVKVLINFNFSFMEEDHENLPSFSLRS